MIISKCFGPEIQITGLGAERSDMIFYGRQQGVRFFNSVIPGNWKTITVKKCKNVASYDNRNLSVAPDCGNEGNST